MAEAVDLSGKKQEPCMSISYEQAVEKLNDWTKSPALRNHARAVEAAMRRAAHRYGAGDADELRWAITGLLHDADYDQWPDEHPRLIVNWLTEQGEPEIAHAVAAHFTVWGVEPVSPLDKALLACDELAGFVMACCFVRPEGIGSLSPSSVKKKLKDKSFAAKVDRAEVYAGIERLGTNIDEHIQLVIEALVPLAKELGIEGASRPPGEKS
jgi:predicted hydrolase (HD superfamily)